jgi:hypothetical protein
LLIRCFVPMVKAILQVAGRVLKPAITHVCHCPMPSQASRLSLRGAVELVPYQK